MQDSPHTDPHMRRWELRKQARLLRESKRTEIQDTTTPTTLLPGNATTITAVQTEQTKGCCCNWNRICIKSIAGITKPVADSSQNIASRTEATVAKALDAVDEVIDKSTHEYESSASTVKNCLYTCFKGRCRCIKDTQPMLEEHLEKWNDGTSSGTGNSKDTIIDGAFEMEATTKPAPERVVETSTNIECGSISEMVDHDSGSGNVMRRRRQNNSLDISVDNISDDGTSNCERSIEDTTTLSDHKRSNNTNNDNSPNYVYDGSDFDNGWGDTPQSNGHGTMNQISTSPIPFNVSQNWHAMSKEQQKIHTLVRAKLLIPKMATRNECWRCKGVEGRLKLRIQKQHPALLMSELKAQSKAT